MSRETNAFFGLARAEFKEHDSEAFKTVEEVWRSIPGKASESKMPHASWLRTVAKARTMPMHSNVREQVDRGIESPSSGRRVEIEEESSASEVAAT